MHRAVDERYEHAGPELYVTEKHAEVIQLVDEIGDSYDILRRLVSDPRRLKLRHELERVVANARNAIETLAKIEGHQARR